MMARLSAEEAIADIREDLGTLAGRMGSLETSISRIDDSLRKLLENNGLIVEIHRTVISHDKRIGVIENRCHQREPEIAAMKEHMKTDRPVEAVAGEWALGLVLFAAGGVAWWLLTKAPKIWELLN